MSQLDLIQLARSGDATAIATLMNATLQAIGITARVTLTEDDLYVLLESEQVVAEQSAIEFVQQGMTRLGIGWLSSIVVYSRLIGDSAPIWVQKIDCRDAAIVNPFVVSPEQTLTAQIGGRAIGRLPWRRVRLFNLLLLTVPLMVLLNAGHIWSRYLMGAPAVKPSRVVTPSSDRQQTLSDKQPSTNDPFQAAIQQADRAVTQGQSAKSRAAWHAVAADWIEAIAWLKRVPANHPKAAIARRKLVEYQRHLNYLAKDRLSTADGMVLKKVITGSISPKSIVYSGSNLFFAQNMMYNHSITVYDRDFNLIKTIADRVQLSDYNHLQFKGTQQGAPVEAAFTQNGKTAWVSNYQMYGTGFKSAADDTCSPANDNDPSFVYRIDTQALQIDRAVQVGAVPKSLAAAPDNRFVLVSNWCSWDVSIIDPQQNKEVRRIQVGPYPRGIAVDAESKMAYVAVMGSHDIATIDLTDFSVHWIRQVGRSPRHLTIDPNGKFLYATLNGEGSIAKIDLMTGKTVNKAATGEAPRSMTISSDGEFVYVVNYNTDTVSKVRTMDMKVVQTVRVNPAPIGITYDPKTHQVWVACYSGSILVFQD